MILEGLESGDGDLMGICHNVTFSFCSSVRDVGCSSRSAGHCSQYNLVQKLYSTDVTIQYRCNAQ